VTVRRAGAAIHRAATGRVAGATTMHNALAQARVAAARRIGQLLAAQIFSARWEFLPGRAAASRCRRAGGTATPQVDRLAKRRHSARPHHGATPDTIFDRPCRRGRASELDFIDGGNILRDAEGNLMTRTVLLVDDDADVLHCLTRMLQRQPYQLYTARSGDEAMTLLKCRHVDVIVADERMPGMTGSELLAWVARNYPDVICLMLTGQASVDAVMRAINEGSVYHVFTKPCNEVDLAIMIRKALEHKERAEQRAEQCELAGPHARDCEQCAQELDALNHRIARDADKPLHVIAQSCQSLLEKHPELLDPKAQMLIEEALDAVTDMQSLVEDLVKRMRQRQSALAAAQPSADQAATT
jgi:FixJ family two-component response regulator